MKKICMLIAFSLLTVCGAMAKAPKALKAQKGAPVFTSFKYTGQDAVYDRTPLKADETFQPILHVILAHCR